MTPAPYFVAPAKAGAQALQSPDLRLRMPAFAGMTVRRRGAKEGRLAMNRNRLANGSEIEAAEPVAGIHSAGNARAKGRMRPIRRVRHETMLDRVGMRIVHVSRKVAIVADRVLPAHR
jgi:hypothetical protein